VPTGITPAERKKGPKIPTAVRGCRGIKVTIRGYVFMRAIVGGAMTIADYFAICVLLVLTLWVTARVYLQSRRF